MGIFGKKKETVTPVKTLVTFADQLSTIKETFKTAYMKADALNTKIEEDIKAKNTAIGALQVKLAESETTRAETQQFMKNLEKFI